MAGIKAVDVEIYDECTFSTGEGSDLRSSVAPVLGADQNPTLGISIRRSNYM
jgi:hypothetical protein